MGFYLRKSISLGPIRINLSKSGLGFSTGVKGLRLGIRPDGRSYVHAGRYGLYYRQELGRPAKPEKEVADVATPPTFVYDPVLAGTVKDRVQGGLAALLQDSYSRPRLDYLAIGVLLVACAFGFAWNWIAGGVVSVLSILVVARISCWETRRRTVYLNYQMEGIVLQAYQRLVDSFNRLASCSRIWVTTSSTRIDSLAGFKQHAGATSLSQRAVARVGDGTPPWVEANVQIPTIQARGQTLYFLPDGIVVYDHTGVAFIDYTDVSPSTETVRFIEESSPHDAVVVDRTWLHPNKDGGPDKRFAENRQLPVCLYGDLELRSPSGLLAFLQTSRHDVPSHFAQTVTHIAAEMKATRTSSATDGNVDAFRPWVDIRAERFESLNAAMRSSVRGIGAGALAGVKWTDLLLKNIAGEGNRLVHSFLRVLAILLASILVAVVPYFIAIIFGLI
jgi:hypothetical protein